MFEPIDSEDAYEHQLKMEEFGRGLIEEGWDDIDPEEQAEIDAIDAHLASFGNLNGFDGFEDAQVIA